MNSKQDKLAAALLYLKKNNEILKIELEKIGLNYKDLERYLGNKFGIELAITEKENVGEAYVLKTSVDFKLFPDVPPEHTNVVLGLLRQTNLNINEDQITEIRYYIPKQLDIEIGCICCPIPLCKIYPEKIDVPNSTDRLASMVCPSDAISTEWYPKKIRIDETKCFGCYLCVDRCPIGVIQIINGIANVSERKDDSAYEEITKHDRFEAERDFIKQIKRMKLTKKMNNRLMIEKGLLDRIGPKGFNLHQDPFYIWCRNVLRSMGKEVKYSGGVGMKTRADLLMDNPLFTFEVKTPAEGAPKKAVRQVDDAATQLYEKEGRIAGRGIICWKPTPDLLSSVEQKKKHMAALGVKDYNIIVISTHIMIYLFLLYRDGLIITETIDSILKINGELTKDKLKEIIKQQPLPEKSKDIIFYEVDRIKEGYY